MRTCFLGLLRQLVVHPLFLPQGELTVPFDYESIPALTAAFLRVAVNAAQGIGMFSLCTSLSVHVIDEALAYGTADSRLEHDLASAGAALLKLGDRTLLVEPLVGDVDLGEL